jgi:hypothetical protein
MRRRGRALIALAAGLAALAIAACGSEDFENDPRPAVPAEVSIELGENEIAVSPAEFGAGLTNFTVANLGDVPAAIEIEGPVETGSDEIPPGGTSTFKTELTTGDYEASAAGADVQPFEFAVGPDRESAQNELLLP